MTANIQLSAKHPDGRIFVIGGDNFDEFFANAVAFFPAEQAERVVEEFQFLLDPSAAPAVEAAAPLRTGAPAAAPTAAASAPGAPMCDHGPRTFRTGKSAKGNWSAWFCAAPQSTPKAQQCEPLWG